MRSFIGNITRRVQTYENFQSARCLSRKLHKIEDKNLSEFRNISESKNVLSISDDPDKFGPDHLHEEFIETEADKKEDEYLKNPPHEKPTIMQYAFDIKDNLNKGLLKNAMSIVDVDMKQSRVAPDRYIFNLLISGAARQGQMELAFKLFQKMKKYGCKPSGATYTSLFNSCANTYAPKHIALKKANYLRNLVFEKSEEINIKTYNAMIKAYGRCEDIQTAFLLVDEMLEKNIRLTTETYNFLLQACASKKTNGFFYALLIWNKMNKMHCYPDKSSFNLFLRCIRDCSIGDDVKLINEAMYDMLNDDHLNMEVHEEELKLKQIADDSKMKENPFHSSSENLAQEDGDVQHLTETETSLPSQRGLDENFLMQIQTPDQRLQLVGGFSGYLRTMKMNKITPNIKTFTMLLEVIPGTIEAENELLRMLRRIGLKVDIDFFNALMKKRSIRFDYENARNVLELVKINKLHPNISTYGVLALGCRTPEQADQFLAEMDLKDIKLNIEILGTFLRQGTAQNDFPYIEKVLQLTLDKELRPNEEFLRHLEKFYIKCLKIEKQQSDDTTFSINFNHYKKKLNSWKIRHGIGGLDLEQSIRAVTKQYVKAKEQSDGLEDTKNFKLIRFKKPMKYMNKI